MPLLLQVDGKVIVEEGIGDPWRCPECKAIFLKHVKGGKVRCPACQLLGVTSEFEPRFTELCKARVIVPVG